MHGEERSGNTRRTMGGRARSRTRHTAAALLALAALAVLRAPELVLGPFTAGTGRASTVEPDATDRRAVTADTQAPPTTDAPARSAPDSPPERPTDVRTRRTPGTPGLLAEVRGGWRAEAGAGEAAALAVQAAHRWTEEDPAVAGTTRASTIVTVEAVERPGARHAVVTLLITTGERLERVGVPIRFGDEGPVLAGPPWPLPAPALTLEPLTGEATGDTVLLEAARRALDAVGIDGARLVGLEVTDGWPFIARLDDGGAAWLRWHLDRFVVAGLPLARAGEAPQRMTNTDANEPTENGG